MPQKVPWRHRAAVPNQVWESERSLVGLSPSVSGGDPPALPGRHPEFDNSGSGMRNSRS